MHSCWRNRPGANRQDLKIVPRSSFRRCHIGVVFMAGGCCILYPLVDIAFRHAAEMHMQTEVQRDLLSSAAVSIDAFYTLDVKPP